MPLLPTEQATVKPENMRFLLICVKGRQQRTYLKNVNISKVTNDPLLFKEIKMYYKELRDRFWLYIPISIKFIKVILSPINSRHVAKLIVEKFELFKLRDGYTVGILEEDVVPPKEEVKDRKTYHYHPCPLLGMPPIPPDLFMLGLSEPECLNEDDLCMNRLPKKLMVSLTYRDRMAQENIGWGVLIVEGLNRPLLAGLWLTFLLFSSTTCLVWSFLKSDVQGGFGIGSFLVGVLSAFLAALALRT
jgi:hypothetical protein